MQLSVWLLRGIALLVMVGLSVSAVWFGFQAFDFPRLPSALGLAFLVAFTFAGAVIYWMERYR